MEALLDTGSDQTLIHQQYVPFAQVNVAETVPICCVHGDEKAFRTTDVYITVQKQTYFLTVAVADKLPFPVILGHDLPVLFDLLQLRQMCNVVTRSQRLCEQDVSPFSALPFFNTDFEVLPGKPHRSCRQRRKDKFAGTPVKPSVIR